MKPTRAQIEAADKAYDEAYEKYRGERGRTHRLALIAALTAAAEAGEDKAIEASANELIEQLGRERDIKLATIERCAQVVAGEIYKEHYRKWPSISTVGNRANNDEITMHCDRLAAAIRALKDQS